MSDTATENSVGSSNSAESADSADSPGTAEFPDRDTPQKRILRAVAAQAAVLSAAVHLLWAWPQLSATDPRPYVFVVAALFTGLVAAATLQADEYRRLYALGAGTLGAFLVGYVGWYGTSLPIAIAADPLALVGKIAEAIGVVAFGALYRLAPPTNVVLERRRAEGRKAPLSVLDPDRLEDAGGAGPDPDSADEQQGQDGR